MMHGSANGGGGLSPSSASLSNPLGLAVDSTGGLYVADQGNQRVLYFAPGQTSGSAVASRVYGQGPTGTSYTTAGVGTNATALGSPTAVALDSGGNLYVCDSSTHT